MENLKIKWALADGRYIPSLGLGFWQVAPEEAERVVREGYEVGYRHFDTAIAYGNEAEIGAAIAKLPCERKEIFLTSKIPAEIKSYQGAKQAIAESLSRLGLDYIDLMLIHAPKPWMEMVDPSKTYRYEKENAEVFQALLEAQKEGKIKSVGVSNFNVHDIQSLIEKTGVTPAANQIPCYIGHVEGEVIAYCKEHRILVEGYSPLATGQLVAFPAIQELAKKKGVSVPQLCVRFVYQLGALPLPKTTHKEYMANDADIDFILTPEEMALLMNASFTRQRKSARKKD